MTTRYFASFAAALAVSVAALGLAQREQQPASAPPAQPAAPSAQGSPNQTFTLDGVHSSVMFRIEHNGVSNFYGAFKHVSGTYTLGDAPSFDIIVKADSVDTRNDGRDRHLKSPDFFNAAEFPNITFKSTKAEKAGDNWNVTGDLTLHGVTKPITCEIRTWPVKQTDKGAKSGFETHLTIKRSDFGMNTYIAEGGLGDEVTILVAGEGGAK